MWYVVAMTADTLKEMLRRSPFEAFRVALSSGESYDVLHPETALASARSLVLAVPDKGHPEGERLVFCSYLHIAHIEVLSGQPDRRAG